MSISSELKENVDFGKSLSRISPFNLTLWKPEKETTEFSTDELMACGTKLMDAILFQHVQRKNLISFQKSQNPQAQNSSEIGEALFCIFYCILTKGKVPVDQEEIPLFIRDVFKNPEPFHVYAKMLASFDINLLDKIWLKRIQFHGIPYGIKRRLTFGALHHEILEVFRIFLPENIENSKYRDSYFEVMEHASNGPSWNLFLYDFYEDIWCKLNALIKQIYSPTQIEQIKKYGIKLDEHNTDCSPEVRAKELKFLNNPIFTDKMLWQPDSKTASSKLTFPIYFHSTLKEGPSTEDEPVVKAFVTFNAHHKVQHW